MIRKLTICAAAWLVLFAVLPLHADEDPIFMRVRTTLSHTLQVEEDSITMNSSLEGLGMTEANKDDVKRNLEVEFGVIIPPDRFDQMHRVADVVRFFHEQLDQ